MNQEINIQKEMIVCNICKKRPGIVSLPYLTKAVCNSCEDIFTNLTEQVQKKPPVLLFREKELLRLAQVLSRITENNAILIGETGMGKTSIVEGFAYALYQKNFSPLNGYKILSLSIDSLLSNTKYRGDFEEKFKSAIKLLDEKTILFIDEFHTVMGAGAANDSKIDMANLLKTKTNLKIIGATTLEEYRVIEKDRAFNRRFTPIRINELTKEQTLTILKTLTDFFENEHNVEISEECFETIIELTDRYIKDYFFPNKAINVLDQVCANVSLIKNTKLIRDNSYKELEEIEYFENRAQKLNVSYPGIKEMIVSPEEIQKEKDYNAFYEIQKQKVKALVTREHIFQEIETRTGIPISELNLEERSRLLNLEDEMKKFVVGQDTALKALVKAIRRSRMNFERKEKPVVLCFVGPSGCGKTEAAFTAAKFLNGSSNALIRFDMSEFMEKHDTSKLIGAPPGYVGYEEEGQLTEKVRRNPYSIILLDEWEKAHKAVADLFLQVFEDGRLTDSKSRVIDFSNTIIIMTSNIGTQEENKTVGFLQPNNENTVNSKKALSEAYRPEFINRIDEIITFNTLSKENMMDILDMKLKNYHSKLEEYQKESLKDDTIKVHFNITQEAKEYLVEKGFDPKMGARPLGRLLQSEIKDVILEKLLIEPSLTHFEIYEKHGELKIA